MKIRSAILPESLPETEETDFKLENNFINIQVSKYENN